MMMSRVVLKHQWIMLMVMSQWRMSGSISHMKYFGMSSIVDQWQDAGGVSGMLKMFMGEDIWGDVVMRLELLQGSFADVPKLGCFELVGSDCRLSYERTGGWAFQVFQWIEPLGWPTSICSLSSEAFCIGRTWRLPRRTSLQRRHQSRLRLSSHVPQLDWLQLIWHCPLLILVLQCLYHE